MKRFIFFIPFFYFAITRLKGLKNLIFHSYFEWISAIGILFFVQGLLLYESIENFLIGYLAFISLYEIGYITNDQFSEKSEDQPRNRYDKNIPNFLPVLWILVRVLLFIAITFWAGFQTSLIWWTFYAGLVISFSLHNVISNPDFRVITFFNLSLFRFLAPFFMFLTQDSLQLMLPTILVNYCFYRTIIYMDSKDLLKIRSRKTPIFNLSFFLIVLMASVFFGIALNSLVPIMLSLYFLVFALIYYIKETFIKNKN